MSTTQERSARRSAPELYLLLWGAGLVFLGTMGFFINHRFPTGHHVTDDHDLLGMFHTNGWHNLAGLAGGVTCFALYRRGRSLPLAAAFVGLATGIVPTVAFLLVGDGNVAFNLIPVDFVDTIVFHLVPGLVGIACAALPAPAPALTPTAAR